MINDTRGHDAGDQLLVAVSDRLRNIVREIDTLARLGGDEFVMLLEDLDKDLAIAASQAKLVGEKVLAVLAEPYLIYDNEFYCTVSIGVSMYRGLETAEELLGYADLAMYEAKSTGRNGLRFFDATMQEVVTARSMLEQDLRQALAKNQFKIFFQLQTNHDGQILGAEALLRWEHPERGLVLPMEFIHLAEETKLILPIGLWVLNAACAQLKIWEDMPQAQHLQLAVNVSAYQFHQACFVEQVCTVLEKHAIQADRLKLEITESLLTSNIDDTLIKMKALKNIGIHFSMDDFGTGYSSLSVLKKLPINQLKIDQSFIRDISIDSDDAIIVQTIIAMANKLGMEVIAEGVETEEQRAFLELQGCPVIQGYLFGKPVPIEQFEQLLNHN
jgi:diguanylate cyclase (GGDEF)-like protein